MMDCPQEITTRVAALKSALVIGAGTMGSGIARLLTTSGFTVKLVDPFEKNLTKTADSLKLPAEQRFTSLSAKALEGVELVIEAATENKELKKSQVYQVIGKVYEQGGLLDNILIGTNTSSIPITELSLSLPEGLRPVFMGTHFFNPAHYMKLLELIPGAHTSRLTHDTFLALAKTRLSKEVAVAADLPGFIVNRLLIFDYANQMADLAEDRYTIEEIDAVMGAPVGRPMGPFQLADLVGNDLFPPIGKVIYEGVSTDPLRARFIMPAFLDQMIAAGKLGAKSGGKGFYAMEGRKPVGVYDLSTRDYRKIELPNFASVTGALKEKDVLKRIERLVFSESADRGRAIARRYIVGLVNYTKRLTNIIGDARSIETGMLYGLNHRLGPSAILASALGPKLRELSKQMHDETGDQLYELT